MPVILIGGGSRSGKSSHALALARQLGHRPGFIATAQAFDDEMRDRIARHQAERAGAFLTIEEPFELPRALRDHNECDILVVDCLTLWLSNLMLNDLPVPADDLLAAARGRNGSTIFVTNEVGCGIVPENALARRFRDLAGTLNRQIAEAAGEVYWMAFGIPLKLK